MPQFACSLHATWCTLAHLCKYFSPPFLRDAAFVPLAGSGRANTFPAINYVTYPASCPRENVAHTSGRTSMCAQAWVQRFRHVRAQCPLWASKIGSKPGEFDAYTSHWISNYYTYCLSVECGQQIFPSM